MPITTLNITKPFAENGDRAQIPAFSQNESVSYDEGWTEAYSRLASDRFFNREDINGILYSITIACIINDENMQFVREEANDDRVAIRAEVQKGLTDLGNELAIYVAQIDLNKDNIRANQDLIDAMQQQIDELVEKVGNGDLDNNLLDPIRQSIILIQERLDDLDLEFGNSLDQLALKANKADVYTKDESDDLFALKADITSIFKYIGAVDDYNALLTIDQAALKDGYIYLCENNLDETHPMGFYVYTDGAFSRLSEGALSINDKNYAKLDRANLFATTSKIETPNAQDDNDIMTLGEVNKQIQDYDQNLQIQLGVTTNETRQLRADLTAEINTRAAETTRLINDIKQNAIDIALVKKDTEDLDVRVEALENNQGGGGTIDPDDLTNLAQLNKENTFTQENTFNLGIQIPTGPRDDNSATNKDYVDTKDKENLEIVNEILKDYVKLSGVQEVDYYNQLPQGQNPGAVYKVTIGDIQHKAGYYMWNGEEWFFVGSAVQEIETAGFAMLTKENTFTQENTFEADVILQGGNPKTDNSAVNKKYLDSRLTNAAQDFDLKLADYAKTNDTNTFSGINTFTTTPKITSAITSNADVTNKKYVDDAIALATANINVDTTNLAKLNAANTFTGANTFNDVVNVQEPTSDTNPATKKYVDDAIAGVQGGGGGGTLNPDDLKDYANLTTDNSFTKDTIFEGTITKIAKDGTTIFDVDDTNAKFNTNPTIETPKANDDLADNNVMSKANVVEMVSTIRVISDNAPNRDDLPIGSLWIKTTYAQDADEPSIFTDTPAIYIKVLNGWWDLHREALL